VQAGPNQSCFLGLGDKTLPPHSDGLPFFRKIGRSCAWGKEKGNWATEVLSSRSALATGADLHREVYCHRVMLVYSAEVIHLSINGDRA
jgi:hypothetical protein